MITRDMIGRIRRLNGRKNQSEREIARITGLSRNTVAKWLHGEVDGRPKHRLGGQPNKLCLWGLFEKVGSAAQLGLNATPVHGGLLGHGGSPARPALLSTTPAKSSPLPA